MSQKRERSVTVNAFRDSFDSIAEYKLSASSGVAREFDYADRPGSYLRFHLPGFGRVVDLPRPRHWQDTKDPTLSIQLRQAENAKLFPTGELPLVLDARLFLSQPDQGSIRRGVARTALYGVNDGKLLEQAQLVRTVLAGLTVDYEEGMYQFQNLSPEAVAKEIPPLPDRLVQMATQLD